MRRYSDRARRNSRLGIELRMKTIQAKIKEINTEIVLYTRYQKSLRSRWIARVLVVLRRKLRIRQGQLGRYKERYDRLKKEGKI